MDEHSSAVSAVDGGFDAVGLDVDLDAAVPDAGLAVAVDYDSIAPGAVVPYAD